MLLKLSSSFLDGFITVEMGTKEEIATAIQTAISILGTGGGFILSPVDNIRDTSEKTWENVEFMIERWKNLPSLNSRNGYRGVLL